MGKGVGGALIMNQGADRWPMTALSSGRLGALLPLFVFLGMVGYPTDRV